MPRRKAELAGRTFGRLTVIEWAGCVDGTTVQLWRCRCECGTEKVVRAGDLTRGSTASCGCLHRGPEASDLTGQRFGRLTVVADTGERRSGGVVWLCRCECGGEWTGTAVQLVRGTTRSCGCIRREYLAAARASAQTTAIIADLKSGMRQADAARKYHLSRQRIGQIAAVVKAMDMKEE